MEYAFACFYENDFIAYIFNIAWVFSKCNQKFLFPKTISSLSNLTIIILCTLYVCCFVNGYTYNAAISKAQFVPIYPIIIMQIQKTMITGSGKVLLFSLKFHKAYRRKPPDLL